jgi:hypothetical protein
MLQGHFASWRRKGHCKGQWKFALVLGGSVLFVPLTAIHFARDGAAAGVPTILGPNVCGECHKQEVEAWKGSSHFRTFREMPRSDRAKDIGRKLGISRVNSDKKCLSCHYTSVEAEGKLKPIAGISCESCHGAGRDWLKIHSSYSGKKADTESKSEAAARWNLAVSKGMIRPDSIYRLAKNCYGCHVVPDEDIVNKGGHRAGSPFELVSWSQGEVRHNTWHSKGKANVAAGPDRKRILFLVGLGVELETSLRAVAKATVRDVYAFEMAKRVDQARRQLAEVAPALPNVPELGALVDHANATSLKLDNKTAMTAAADAISVILARIGAKYDGGSLAGLDRFIPAPADYKGAARKAAVP